MKRDCTCPRASHVHGTRAAYQRDRCRCFPCRMANHYAQASYTAGESWREYDDTLVPSHDTAQELRALMALGYTSRDISERSGLTEGHVQNLRTDARHPRVTVEIAEAVHAVFAELWDKPSRGREANRQRTRARALGYPLPMQIGDTTSRRSSTAKVIDEIAVERRIRGDRQRLTISELSHAVLTLYGKGWTTTAIAKQLRMSGTRVQQIVGKEAA